MKRALWLVLLARFFPERLRRPRYVLLTPAMEV